MKKYNVFDLQEILNYDSNIERKLHWVERAMIHKGISRLMNDKPVGFSKDFEQRLADVRWEFLHIIAGES